MIMLNIGCGNYPIKRDSWTNLDKKGLFQKWEFNDNKNWIREFDIEQFPYYFADESVACITISHTLNQVEQHSKIYEEFHRILKKGGVLRITDDDNGNEKGKYGIKPHFHTKTLMIPKLIKFELETLGFEVNTMPKTKTVFHDKLICMDNHKELEPKDKFYMEAIKLE